MTRSEYYLHELLIPNQEQALIDGASTYRLIKLRLYQKGVELRQTKIGSELGSKQFIAKQGQFIISKIDARNGAMGIVPENLDRAVVTGDFLLFDFNRKLVDSGFFNYYTRLPNFDQACKLSSEGSTNRVRLKIDKFLNIRIPLPSLDVQKKIIDIVETVSESINEIREVREGQAKDIKNLLYSKYSEIIEDADWINLEFVAPIHRRPVKIELNETYQELGTRSFFKGVFEKESFRGSDLTWEKPHWMKAGDLVFSNIKAWEGSVALISERHEGWVASHRYITCLPNHELIKPEFLLYFFSTPDGMDILGNVSPGSADRNRTLNTKKLMQAKVPVPALALQEEFVDLAHQIEVLHDHHKQIDKELNELMPSLLDKAFKGEL